MWHSVQMRFSGTGRSALRTKCRTVATPHSPRRMHAHSFGGRQDVCVGQGVRCSGGYARAAQGSVRVGGLQPGVIHARIRRQEPGVWSALTFRLQETGDWAQVSCYLTDLRVGQSQWMTVSRGPEGRPILVRSQALCLLSVLNSFVGLEKSGCPSITEVECRIASSNQWSKAVSAKMRYSVFLIVVLFQYSRVERSCRRVYPGVHCADFLTSLTALRTSAPTHYSHRLSGCPSCRNDRGAPHNRVVRALTYPDRVNAVLYV